MKLKKPATFLLVLADMAKYTRLLRLLDLANFMAYEFLFELRQPPLATSPLSALTQSQLLLPFECVRGGAMIQKVTFRGAFDHAIMERVRQAMTQKVAWLRASAWEIHDIALSIKRMGDWAFRLKNADLASAKYMDMEMFLDTARGLHSMVKGIDVECEKATCALAITAMVDTSLLMLSDFTLAEFGKEGYPLVIKMTKRVEEGAQMNEKGTIVIPHAVIARFYYLLGIAELGLNHPSKAGKAFAKSYKMVSSKATRTGHEAAKVWAHLDAKAQTARLKTVLASLPTEPFAVPDMKPYSTLEVASEHWVMRELGLQGPIPYADKIKGSVAIVLTNKPHPKHHNRGPRTARVGEVKEEVLRKHVDKFRKQINHPLAQGRLICWVGLNANEIGEATILDEPGFPGYDDVLQGMGRSACNTQ